MIEKYVSAEELRRLLSTLFVFLGAIAIAVLFAVTIVPGLRNANRPEAPTPVSPVIGEPGWLDPTEFPPERGKEVPPVDPEKLIAYSPELVARGKVLFTANCVQCHGDLGQGDGPAAPTMNPRPRNFTVPEGWKNGPDLPAIFRTLSTGLQGTSMSSFDYLPKSDRMALAHFVQALGTFPHGTGSPGSMEALSKELAAAGERTHNRIPVSMAMAKLVQEFRAPAPLSVAPEDHGPGAELIRRVVTDPSRAAGALAGSAAWRSGPKELAASILPETPGNGFSVAIATLSPAEWQALHAELVRISPRPE